MAFLDLWHEYEKASHGRKRITTSRGLFAKYGVGEAREDQEIVDEDTGGQDVIALPRQTWNVLAGYLAAELRIVAEREGPSGAAGGSQGAGWPGGGRLPRRSGTAWTGHRADWSGWWRGHSSSATQRWASGRPAG
jgi:hypothetical protein